MELLDTIEGLGLGSWRIELRRGDLAALPPEEAVDLLVVSAFPNDYTPTPGSLIGALQRAGLSVGALAADKDIDTRELFSTWLSKPVTAIAPGLHVGRILCFEPVGSASPPERVGDIFRGLVPMLMIRPGIRSVAMPVVAAGDRRFSVEEMLEPLLDAATNWLQGGLALDRIVIAVRDETSEAVARGLFTAARERMTPSFEPVEPTHDVFVSYAHTDVDAANTLVTDLKTIRPGIRVFIDHELLHTGMVWQIELYECLERSRKVVPLLSPAYLASKPCKDELNIAWIQSTRVQRRLIHPLFMFKADLPAHIAHFEYDDCRDGDPARIRAAAERLMAALDHDL